MSQDKLIMKFEPNTIEHLGIRMYSQIPKVLAELISNAYDADAEVVIVRLEQDEKGNKSIIVNDDGIGLTFEEINDEFLTIGRNRREKNNGTTEKNRKVMGKKGIGKLAFFGVAEKIKIETKKNGKKNVFLMDWNDIRKSTGIYEPKIIERDTNCDVKERGTIITLENFRKSFNFNVDNLERSLARLFVITEDFKIILTDGENLPKTVSNKPHYHELDTEFPWNIPGDLPVDLDDVKKYFQRKGVFGKIYTAIKPIKPNTELSGIILFSRKKMVNAPSYFSSSESSYFFSYLAGYLEVDFIDELEDDVISTDRQSLIWDSEEMQTLYNNIQKVIIWLQTDWREKRKEKKTKMLKRDTNIDTEHWYNTVPEEYREDLTDIVDELLDPEVDEEKSKTVINLLHGKIIPEYARCHWRTLHPEIYDAAKTYYQDKYYYAAFMEAAKRYEMKVMQKLDKDNGKTGRDLMGSAFGADESQDKIKVTEKFTLMEGAEFRPETISSIEDGQKLLSMGTMAGHRNPLSHEEISALKETGLFTEMDCLDALSLLSHLSRRLDSAAAKTKSKKSKAAKPKS